MNLKKLLGLEFMRGYCVRKLDKNSLILIAMKKKKKELSAPEKIGRYTVVGIDNFNSASRLGKAFYSLSDTEKKNILKMFDNYVFASSLDVKNIPKTVEYLGYYSCGCTDSNNCRIPEQVRYIELLSVSPAVSSVSLPSGLLYLGKINSYNKLTKILFEGGGANAEPRNPPALYFGRDIGDLPLLDEGALYDCEHLFDIKIQNEKLSLGKNSLPKCRIIDYGYMTTAYTYRLSIPKGYKLDDKNVNGAAIVETLVYPDNIADSLRLKEVGVYGVNRLVIRDFGRLEEYLKLVYEGNAPDEYSDKCLYHLLRIAKEVVIETELTRVFDYMFCDCKKLESVSVGGCAAKKGEVFLGESCAAIGKRGFYGCNGINYIQLKMGIIREIGEEAFANSSLERIEIPVGVFSIGDRALCNCKRLRYATFCAGIRSFGRSVFKGCEMLAFTPHNYKMLEKYPVALEEIRNENSETVERLLREGDAKIAENPRAYSCFHEAFDLCFKALKIEPDNRTVLNRMSEILLNKDFGICMPYSKVLEVKKFLVKAESHDLIPVWDEVIVKLVKMSSAIKKKSKTVKSMRDCYARSCDFEAAIFLSEFLLSMMEKHPDITAMAKKQLIAILSGFIFSEASAHTDELNKKMEKLRTMALKALGKFEAPASGCVADVLQSSQMIKKAENAMSYKASYGNTVYNDAEMWCEIAKELNSKVEIPRELINYRERPVVPDMTISRMLEYGDSSVFGSEPEPWRCGTFDFESSSSSYYESEPNPDVEELVSEYWRNKAEEAERRSYGNFTYDDIESEWLDLDAIGFWDDKSWQ